MATKFLSDLGEVWVPEENTWVRACYLGSVPGSGSARGEQGEKSRLEMLALQLTASAAVKQVVLPL